MVGTTLLLRDPIDGTEGTMSGAAVHLLPDIGVADGGVGTTAAEDLPVVLLGAGRP